MKISGAVSGGNELPNSPYKKLKTSPFFYIPLKLSSNR